MSEMSFQAILIFMISLPGCIVLPAGVAKKKTSKDKLPILHCSPSGSLQVNQTYKFNVFLRCYTVFLDFTEILCVPNELILFHCLYALLDDSNSLGSAGLV